MINQNLKSKSPHIDDSLKNGVRKGSSTLRLVQEGETNNEPVLISQKANNSIITLMLQNPGQGQGVRWVKENTKNKVVLTRLLIKRVVLRILVKYDRMYYMPCCNTFSKLEPKKKQGHKYVTSDCLLLLLGKQTKSEILGLKNQLKKQNKSLPSKELLEQLQVRLTSHFEKKSPLEWLGGFIDTLPQNGGCFQLPLIKGKPFEICPGPCLHFEGGASLLDFAVNSRSKLTPSTNQVTSPDSSPSPPLRQKERYTRSSKKSSSKKLKVGSGRESPVKSASKKDTPTPHNDNNKKVEIGVRIPIFLESESSISEFQVKKEVQEPQDKYCELSLPTTTKFEIQSYKPSKHSSPLFRKQVNLDDSISVASKLSRNHSEENKVSNHVDQLGHDSIASLQRIGAEGPGSPINQSFFQESEESSFFIKNEPEEDDDENSFVDQTLREGDQDQERLVELMNQKVEYEKQIQEWKQEIVEVEQEIGELEQKKAGIDEEIFRILRKQDQRRRRDGRNQKKD